MTTTGKVVIGGVVLSGIGAALYYFLVAKKQPQVALPASGQATATTTTAAATTTAQAKPASTATVTLATAPSQKQAGPATPYEGMVIRADQAPAVYWIVDGIRHGFLSPDALHKAGFDFNQVISVPSATVRAIPEGYQIGKLKGLRGPSQKLLS